MKPLFIFTHIPKTAGMSMNEVLNKQFDQDQILECFFHGDENIPDIPRDEKENVQLLKGHVPYGLHRYFPLRDTYYFTMMRDPIDRVVSLYYYIKERPNHEFYEHMKDKNLIDFCKSFHTETSNVQSFYFTGKRDPDVKEVQIALLDIFAFAGVTEMFDESIFILKNKFNWIDCSYKTVNVTSKRRSLNQLSEEEIEYIKNINKIDLEVYYWLKDRVQSKFNELLSTEQRFLSLDDNF